MLTLLFEKSRRPEDFRVHLHDGRDLDFPLAAECHFVNDDVTAPQIGCTESRRSPSRTTAF